MKHRVFPIVLSLAVLFLLAVSGIAVWLLNTEEQGVIRMTYTFEGAHAEDAGFAEGTVTLTPTEEATADSGWYLLYFADGNGLLAGYDALAAVPVTGDTVSYTVKKGTLLPPAADRLAVFESKTEYADTPPAYDTRAGVIRLPQEKRLPTADASLTFAAVADVHMNYEAHGRGAYRKWEEALNTFAALGMDRVIVAGDMTGDEFEGTLDAQYKTYLDIIKRSDFPLARIHECIGNHGNTEAGRRQFVYYTSGKNEDRPKNGSPWFSLMLENENGGRDTLFLFMAQELKAPGDSAQYDNFSKEQIDWLEEMLETHDDGNTNLFLVEHSPFLHYGPGDRLGGTYTSMVTFKPYYVQTMRLKKLLEKHRTVIHLSGHTHLSLYDGENYSDEDGTSCRMIHISSTCQPKTYRNEEQKLLGGDGRCDVSPDYGSEAYTVEVREDCILFTGRNLSTGTVIPSASYILETVIGS